MAVTRADTFRAVWLALADAIASDPAGADRIVDLIEKIDRYAFYYPDPHNSRCIIVDFCDGSRAELEWSHLQ